MFNSLYSEKLSLYYELRSKVLSKSARMHELCYLKRFDQYLFDHISSTGQITECFINNWVHTVTGKSGSVENEIIVIRQFLKYLALSGETVFIPTIPKVHDDYVPYIFTDDEIARIIHSADRLTVSEKKSDPWLVVEFPVIIRLLYSCGLRLGETVRIIMKDVDLENGILKLINTKGDKHRLVPMSPGMTDILAKYALMLGLVQNSNDWLFPSSLKDDHISERSVSRKFAKLLKDVGIRTDNYDKYERGPCLHCLRHVFAFKSFSKAERAGRQLNDAIPFLSIYLGHDRLDETVKYLKFSSEMFPETVELFGSYMDDLLPEV